VGGYKGVRYGREGGSGTNTERMENGSSTVSVHHASLVWFQLNSKVGRTFGVV